MDKFLEGLLKMKKTVFAAIAGVGTILAFAADGEWSQNDSIGTATVIFGVVTVYLARNLALPEDEA